MSDVETVNRLANEMIEKLRAEGGALLALDALTVALGKVAGSQSRSPNVTAKLAWETLFPLFEEVFRDAHGLRWSE